jgi:hypothetical protein
MHFSITALRDISRRCLSAEPLSDDQARWLGASLSGFLNHDFDSLDEALGLRGGRGGLPWWREEAIRRRNAALNALARCHLAGLSQRARAERIWTLSLRYAASAWRIDREAAAMPAHYAGSEKEFLWAAFMSGATMPVCQRQLRNILDPPAVSH